MPIYEYRCHKCEHEFEREQRITEDPVKTCPKCRSRRVKKLISQTSFVLKGGGWYSDLYSSAKDSGKDKSEGSSSDSGSSDSSSSDSGSSDSGSSDSGSSTSDESSSKSDTKTKSDTKPASKSKGKNQAAA